MRHLPTRPSLWSMNYKPVKLCDCILRGCVTVAAIKKIHCMFHLLQAHVFDGWRFYCRSGNFVALWNQLKIEAPCGCFNTCAKHHRAERPVLSSLSLGFLSLAFFVFFSEWLCLLSLGACPRLSIHDFCQKHKTHHFFCAWRLLLLFFPLWNDPRSLCVYICRFNIENLRPCTSYFLIWSH